jgi:hypothetical protein
MYDQYFQHQFLNWLVYISTGSSKKKTSRQKREYKGSLPNEKQTQEAK